MHIESATRSSLGARRSCPTCCFCYGGVATNWRQWLLYARLISWWGYLSDFGEGKQTQCPRLGVEELTCCFIEWEDQPQSECLMRPNAQVSWTILFFWVYYFRSRLPGHDGGSCCTSVTTVSAMGSSPTGWLPPHWGLLFVSSWMQLFQADGLGAMVQHKSHHVHRILPTWTLYQIVFTPVPDIETLKARIRDV
jgi:hypothetical protein